jgi:hypothetical protein
MRFALGAIAGVALGFLAARALPAHEQASAAAPPAPRHGKK